MIDGYSITQYPNRNLIIISLPQRMDTLVNTVTPLSDRKLELSSSEEGIILTIVKELFEHKKENKNGNKENTDKA